jgi:hypothetical protein
MTGDALGVMLVVVLGGLVMPIGLLLLAALIDVLVVAWSVVRFGFDWGSHRTPGGPLRPSPHG